MFFTSDVFKASRRFFLLLFPLTVEGPPSYCIFSLARFVSSSESTVITNLLKWQYISIQKYDLMAKQFIADNESQSVSKHVTNNPYPFSNIGQ